MQQAVLDAAYATFLGEPAGGARDAVPITAWVDVEPSLANSSRVRKKSRSRRVAVDVALGDDDRISHALLTTLGTALRADSPDAPSTHAEAMARGVIWTKAEEKELGTHAKNES